MIANLEPTPENFQQKPSFFRSRSTNGVKKTFFQKIFLSKSSKNPLDTFSALLAVKRRRFLKPQKGCSFFAKRVTLIRICFWKENLFSQVVDLAIKSALLKKLQKTFFKSRKTSSSRSEDDKKVVFQNKNFSFPWTCRKHFWQFCRKVYVRKPITFRSMFGKNWNKIHTKTYSDSKNSFGCWESSFEKSTQNCSTKNFCADGRKMIKKILKPKVLLKIILRTRRMQFWMNCWRFFAKSRNFLCSTAEKKSPRKNFDNLSQTFLARSWDSFTKRTEKKLILYKFFKVYVFLKKIVPSRRKEIWKPCQKFFSKKLNFFTHCVTMIGNFFWNIELPTSSCTFNKEKCSFETHAEVCSTKVQRILSQGWQIIKKHRFFERSSSQTNAPLFM